MPWVLRSVLAASFALAAVPAAAQEASLGGGSDIRAGSVIPLGRGVSVPPVHHVFADNPEPRPIEVVFRADAPRGIVITPERERFSVDPGTSVKDPFSISVDASVAPGDHRVTVQLVRSDIRPQPGQVTNIPAVGTIFTVRVAGQSSRVTVRAVSAQSRRPVEGTFSLAARTGPGALFEVARAAGTQLEADVAPGDYRAAYLLDGRELASQELRAEAGRPGTAVLEVQTASFVLVSAKPVRDDGKVVVAELVASVENQLRPLSGTSAIRAVVQRDGRAVETVTLREMAELPLGTTDARLTYRPREGFPGGEYRFVFELVTPEFTLRAGTVPSFDVGGGSSVLPLALAGGAGLLATAGAAWAILRRRPRPSGRPSGP